MNLEQYGQKYNNRPINRPLQDKSTDVYKVFQALQQGRNTKAGLMELMGWPLRRVNNGIHRLLELDAITGSGRPAVYTLNDGWEDV